MLEELYRIFGSECVVELRLHDLMKESLNYRNRILSLKEAGYDTKSMAQLYCIVSRLKKKFYFIVSRSCPIKSFNRFFDIEVVHNDTFKELREDILNATNEDDIIILKFKSTLDFLETDNGDNFKSLNGFLNIKMQLQFITELMERNGFVCYSKRKGFKESKVAVTNLKLRYKIVSFEKKYYFLLELCKHGIAVNYLGLFSTKEEMLSFINDYYPNNIVGSTIYKSYNGLLEKFISKKLLKYI